MIAVSKTIPILAMEEAIQSGQFYFGENYIQEAAQKKTLLGKRVGLHLLGHLQSNKVKIASQIFHMIQTVDSLKIASALDRNLESLGKTMPILIQVNIGYDPNKSGVLAEKTQELLQQIKEFRNIEPLGLMTIPPLTSSAEETRSHFKALKQLAEELSRKELFYNNSKIELSMGMSDDFEIAIEEGATMVRVGTSIFGQRT